MPFLSRRPGNRRPPLAFPLHRSDQAGAANRIPGDPTLGPSESPLRTRSCALAKVLPRRGVAAVLRQWADPTTAERLALWGEGSIPTMQAGPASRLVGYDTVRTDGYVHRVGQI